MNWLKVIAALEAQAFTETTVDPARPFSHAVPGRANTLTFAGLALALRAGLPDDYGPDRRGRAAEEEGK